jgi:hypothetical protein
LVTTRKEIPVRKFFLAFVSVLGLTAAANACDYGVQAVRVLQVNDYCAPAVQQVVVPVVQRVYAAPVVQAVKVQQVRVQKVQQVRVQRVQVQRVRQVNVLRVRGY